MSLRKICLSWWIMKFLEKLWKTSVEILKYKTERWKYELSKILMYEFWYGFVKPQYGKKVKLCYMDRDRFIVYIKTDVIYEDIAEDVETRFDTWSYELDRPLLKRMKQKSNWINERWIRWKNNDKIS